MVPMLWAIYQQLIFSWTKGSCGTVGMPGASHTMPGGYKPNGLSLVLAVVSDGDWLLLSGVGVIMGITEGPSEWHCLQLQHQNVGSVEHGHVSCSLGNYSSHYLVQPGQDTQDNCTGVQQQTV